MPRPKNIDDEIVLDRALEVFQRRGYAATSIRELAKATGLGAAALYHRFGDKDKIFVNAIHRYADRGTQDFLIPLAALPDPLDAIATFFDQLIASEFIDSQRRGCLLVNSALDGAAMSDVARMAVRDRLLEVEAFFNEQLQRAQARGLLARDAKPQLLAERLFGAALAIRVLARITPDQDRLRRQADTALEGLVAAREDKSAESGS